MLDDDERIRNLTAFRLRFINELQHLPCDGAGDGDLDNRFKSVKQNKKKIQKLKKKTRNVRIFRI